MADTEDTLILETTQGPVTIEMRPDLAPGHVARIKELVREGFYDGIVFHRVIEGFMAQTGCPQGTGTGGSGKKLKAEFSKEPHVRGTASMARAASPDSGDSFFAGRTSACQREPSRRLISVASIFGSVGRPMRRPESCAAITLVSLTTSWSPGASQFGRSETMWSRNGPSGSTTSIRAVSRGFAGRSAMLVVGSSKSKRSVRMVLRYHQPVL